MVEAPSGSSKNEPDEFVELPKNLRHYEMPNFSNRNVFEVHPIVLYDYTNKEKDIIAQAFRVGNYRYLRDLPNSIGPSKIADTVQNKATINLSMPPPAKKPQSKNGLPEFEWIPDPYDLVENIRRSSEKESREKFISDLPFIPAVHSKKEKYETLLGETDTSMKYYDDPYDAAKKKQVREAWLDRLNFLHGEFKPSLRAKNLEKVGRSLLPDIVIQVRKCLNHDWPDTKFIVGSNPEDYIEIKFDTKTVDNILGLHAYMNHIMSGDSSLSEYKLKKVMQYWGVKEGEYAYYMLAPPWVKIDPKETIYSLYPEAVGIRTSYSQKYNPMNNVKLYSKSINLT